MSVASGQMSVASGQMSVASAKGLVMFIVMNMPVVRCHNQSFFCFARKLRCLMPVVRLRRWGVTSGTNVLSQAGLA